MPNSSKSTSNELSETERKVLSAFLRLSSPKVSADLGEQKLLLSLAIARSMKVAN